MSANERTEVRISEPKTKVGVRIADIARYRELLVSLIRKELRVTYANSVLGFAWSMLNPALYLVIFWIVFTKFLGANIDHFPIYLLSGLLAWNLWSASLGGSAATLLGNANLVTKVYFPREILPLSTIGAKLTFFVFQFLVLLLSLVAFRYGVGWEAFMLVPTALVVELLMLVGACLIVSVLNVYLRDTQHLLELILLAWFWMTPIVYPINVIQTKPQTWLFRLYLLNPMTHIVLAFQRGIYGDKEGVMVSGASVWWYMKHLGYVGAAAAVLVVVGWTIFRKLESRLAEEL